MKHNEDKETRLKAIVAHQKVHLASLKSRLDEIESNFFAQQRSLNSELKRRGKAIDDLTRQVHSLHAQAQSLSEAYLSIKNSLSWKLSRPLRILIPVFAAPLAAAKKLFGGKQPAPVELPEVDSELEPYESEEPFPEASELASNDTKDDMTSIETSDEHRLIQIEKDGREYISLSEQEAFPTTLDVTLLAFYLPQFHTIPENDEWWNEGFTEWTNVKPAEPIFAGHYQPRIAGDLGYYDLRDIEIQKRQMELARIFGLGGFCYYFYWFNGKRLLEEPLIRHRKSKSLDLPFCLCWANENWSRTWDGLDEEVLIGQEHSPEDDIAFISYIAKYFDDERYIRIKDRPLLLVYRPSLLPNPFESAERWREWCLGNGIGDIYLAYTQSFENVAPDTFGFDAAIEFPPNNTAPDVVTRELETIDPEFEGYIYDYNSLAARSYEYETPDYTLFRGVTPSWDNIARRPKTGAVFVGTTPERYGNWLRNAVTDTLQRFEDPSERLVFINAWNEWAEGAYLEPDGVYGYAYLEATREALKSPKG